MSVGDHGVSVGDDRMSAGNSYVCIDREFGLGDAGYSGGRTEAVERTLKT
jgi:hypothetical protein